MGIFSEILGVIANNYIIFVIISVFLVLSLIGYLVDKKTRKDAEVTPIFGSKISLNIKRDSSKIKKGKKNKNKSSDTVENNVPLNTKFSNGENVDSSWQNSVVANTTQQPLEQNYDFNNVAAVNYQNNTVPVQENVSISPIPVESFDNVSQNNLDQTWNNQYAQTAAGTAQITDTIMPNIAPGVAQPQEQGESMVSQTILPYIESNIPVDNLGNNFQNTSNINNNPGNDENINTNQ